jgi:hypothetical protein
MGWDTQDSNKDAKVQVNGGYNKTGGERTDFLIIDKATGDHNHISIGTGAKDGVIVHHGYDGKSGKK